MLRSDKAKRAMLSRVGRIGAISVLAGLEPAAWLGNRRSRGCRCPEPLARIPSEERQHIAHHIPAIVGSVDESFRLLMEICDLPEVSRTDFVIRGFAALGDENRRGEGCVRDPASCQEVSQPCSRAKTG